MIEVLNIDFVPAIPDLVKESGRDRIAFFRDNLKSGPEPERLVDPHQARTEVPTLGCFDVVG
jgi:hypothetical protein